MKNVVFIFLLLCAFKDSFTQDRISKSELDYLRNKLSNNPLLKDDDPDFNMNSSTGNWKEASAVILCQKSGFHFDKKGVGAGKKIGRNIWQILFALPTFGAELYSANARNQTKIVVEENRRLKIILKGKPALEKYSVLYFRLDADGDAFDARVHKTDGTIQKISVEDAVRVENTRSIPEIFASYTDDHISSDYRPAYFKVIVPGLKEGDILEYEYVNYNAKDYLHNPSFKEFDPVYYLCNRVMPADKQVIEVLVPDDQYHFGFKSLLGAPLFQISSSRDGKVYRWEDGSRDKMADMQFVNRYLEMPSVKFQVVYSKKSSSDYIFVHDPRDMKKELTEREFSAKAKLLWFAQGGSSGLTEYKSDHDDEIKELYKSLKNRNVAEDADDEYVRMAYYTIRGKTMFADWTDFAFAKIFAGLLDKKGIKYEVVATSNNSLTRLKNVVFIKEILWAIKYKGRYFSNPNDHLNPGDVPVWLSGNVVVVFADEDEKTAVTTENIPPSDTATNQLLQVIKASLNPATLELTIDQTVQAVGISKQEKNDDILALTPYMENDYRNFDGEDLFEGMNTKERTTAEEEFNQQKKEWKDNQPKMLKALVKEEFKRDVNDEVTFKLLNDGRNFKKQALSYTQKFTLTKMATKAGDEILVALPALLGEQSPVSEEERNRKAPADVGYPRSLQWIISFTIPAGYKVQGLDKMNQDIKNEAGTFTSRATLEGKELVLRIRKSYNTKNLDLAKWPLLVKVLDAAYNFSQQKIVLKKG